MWGPTTVPLSICLLFFVSVPNCAAEPTSNIVLGHASWVQTLDFSPDSRWLASGGDDHTLRVLAIDSGSRKPSSKTLRKFSTSVTAVRFRPQSTTIAVGTWDGQLLLCDQRTGKTIQKFEGHDESVTTVCFNKSGEFMASGSSDDTLVIWDAKTGERLLTFHQGNEYDVTTAAFSADGSRIVSGDGENQIKVWDTESGDEIAVISGHKGTVTSVEFSSDGKYLASSSWDRTIRLWNSEGQLQRVLTGHPADIKSVHFSPYGTLIFSAGEDKAIHVWHRQTGKLIKKLVGHKQEVLCLGVSPDGRWLASGSKAEIRLWKLK